MNSDANASDRLLEALYAKYGPMVLRRCRFLLRDEEEAQDALQEVFMNMLRRPELARAEYPSSLLMATNECLNRIRSRGRRGETREDGLLEAIAAEGDLEARSAAGRLLDRLFGREAAGTRALAVLHFIDGLTLEETAVEGGLSVSGLRKRFRGLKANLATLQGAGHGA